MRCPESCRLQAHHSETCIPRFLGAVDAIQTLSRHGYVLHAASGESSEDLDGYLEGTGVRECFDRLYGQLVGTFKDGPEFYERILEDCGVATGNALVVDDSATAVGWATGPA